MITVTEPPVVLVSLFEPTVLRLLGLRTSSTESLQQVVERISLDLARKQNTKVAGLQARQECPKEGGYVCEILGERRHAATLPLLFSAVVDLFDQLAPETLDQLASQRAYKRRYVSRRIEEIHPGRPDLKVLRTNSGWWISANVGVRDVDRALCALCTAASLSYGRDLIFPARL